MNNENISGGFRGDPQNVQQFIAREMANPETRGAVENELETMRAEQDVGRSPEAVPDAPTWRVVSPEEYAPGYEAQFGEAKWIVRSDERPGESAIVGSEAEAITVCNALNRGSHPPDPRPTPEQMAAALHAAQEEHSRQVGYFHCPPSLIRPTVIAAALAAPRGAPTGPSAAAIDAACNAFQDELEAPEFRVGSGYGQSVEKAVRAAYAIDFGRAALSSGTEET